jgi:hypothetical protein
MSLLGILLGTCGGNGLVSRQLANFSQYDVTVSLVLEQNADGYFLVGTFTPADPDAHFYSKDLPPGGIDGIGRPTRLDLDATSLMVPRGALSESAAPETLSVNPDLPVLPVYPVGPVTLRLPVTLPPGDGEMVKDRVIISYMACTPKTCYRPVVGKIIEVEIPTNNP